MLEMENYGSGSTRPRRGGAEAAHCPVFAPEHLLGGVTQPEGAPTLALSQSSGETTHRHKGCFICR